MKKSFMSNLKNFVDSNVRQRIDRVTHSSGNSDLLSDELMLVERHFDDIRLFCVDAEKKISTMLQSIQLTSSTPSHLGAYTQNVQAGFNNLSHNIAQQAANITSSVSANSGGQNNTLWTNSNHARNHDNSSKNSSTNQIESKLSSIPSTTSQYQSSESLSNVGSNVVSINQQVVGESNTNELTNDTMQKFKKLPVVSFYKFLRKHCNKMKQDSLLALTMTNCSQMQTQLTHLYLTYEHMIDMQCLKPIQQMLETDIPNVLKLKKLYLKAHNDVESSKIKYNGASQKQQQQQIQSAHSASTNSYSVTQNSIQHSNINKLELLKNELEESVTKFEQARDIYEAELFTFVCREPELVNLLKSFYQLQAEYHYQVSLAIQNSLPTINETLVRTPRKFAFGTALEEHRRCTGRRISPVIELCVHFLHLQGLQEEGLFRIPGSSVKIKKLKNGINALFVTLMSLSELETDQGRNSDHSCVVALYDLFKNAVAQQPRQRTQHLLFDSSSQNHSLRGSSLADQASLNQTDLDELARQQPEGKNEDDTYILDVNSIAGLLKLYLRELPEPLFTFTLYDDWIESVLNEADSPAQRIEKLARVARRLPQVFYDNLRHLIKFLNELTQFQEYNKMTSTNLAIAMAPSLMWSRPPTRLHDVQSDNDFQANDAQSLNSQICSFGMSASQHAMILEALINNAASIFPEPSDFTLSEFTHLSLKFTDTPKRTESKREGRAVKSTSPTGLSTASSSSYSSNTSNSTASSVMNRGHSRKGGSMEGLLGGIMVNGQDVKNVTQQNMSTRSIGRPVSVQIRPDEYASIRDPTNVQPSNAPLKPPMPTTRSYSRQMSTESRNTNSSHKLPAPPVPPPTSVRHQRERLKASFQPSATSHSQPDIKPRPVSLRGTGTISSASTNQTTPTAARPSVPPPERPTLTSTTTSVEDACESTERVSNKSAGGFTLLTSGVGLAKNTDANEVEEGELGTRSSSSPIVSSDIISDDDDDSSFDEDSPDRSWTKDSNNEDYLLDEQQESRSGTLKPLVEANEISAQLDQVKSDRSRHSVSENTDVPTGGCDHVLLSSSDGASNNTPTDVKMSQAPPPSRPQPPAKPPRSTSPRITQSTLL